MHLTPGIEHESGPAAWSPAWAAAAVTAAMVVVFALDRATGSAPVQHLYYLPIILAAVRFTMPGGVAAGLSAILLYHAANPHLWTVSYGESDLVQVSLFLAVGVIAARLTISSRHLRRLALTDDLTGLHNLRSFEVHLAAMVRAARQRHASLALLALDVDRLKSLNDQHGHLTGADAVRTVGRIIGQRVPCEAVACRYGGDEFVIAVPPDARLGSRELADELCHAVRDCAPVLAGQAFPPGTLSVSVGVVRATFDPDASPLDRSRLDRDDGGALFGAADAALYRAKALGRNQVCVWVP